MLYIICLERFKNNLFSQFTGFATSETLIGFHPDAGASFLLSHLPGHLGMPVVHCSFSRVVKIVTEFLLHGFVDLDYFWFLQKSDKNIM